MAEVPGNTGLRCVEKCDNMNTENGAFPMTRKQKQRPDDRIGELEDAIKQRDRRIADIKAELVEERDLTHRLAEHVKDCNDQIDEWKQAFEMVPNEEGVWIWRESFVNGGEWLEKYVALVRRWNNILAEYNAKCGYGRNVGRPLLASEAQCATVLKLHKAGELLRGIAEETSLGLQTVRTIISQPKRTDRTSTKYLERIDPERARVKTWMAKKRMRDSLPKKIYALQTTGSELLKEAKGLGRSRAGS